MASTSLIQLILNLLNDPQEFAAFKDNPQSFLDACGAGDATPQDVHDALVLSQDDKPEHHSDQHVPPPPHPEHGESAHDAAVKYLNTYVQNTYVESTKIDNSFHQHVDTHGGDFDQELDYHPVSATGDGAVAAGGNIDGSTVTTGNDNQVGNGNLKGDGNVVGANNQAVTGSHNTTGFGEGNVSSTAAGHDINVGNGAGFATGGSATVDNSDNSAHDSGNTVVDASQDHSNNVLTDNHTEHSGNTTTDLSQNDSNNVHESTHLHDVGNVDNHVHVDGGVLPLA